MSRFSAVSSRKGQMKIQQMAFMLVAVVIFFAMVALIYFSISLANLEERAQQLKDEESAELVMQLAGTPEFTFTSSSDCPSCIDFDKVYYLSKSDDYKKKFWNLDYLMIERVYPNGFDAVLGEKECTSSSYPLGSCNKITIIDGPQYATKTSFVALARWDKSLAGETGGWRYEFGRIHASPKEYD